MNANGDEGQDVVCSRGLSAAGGPELMSLLCRGEAELDAAAELFDRLADESVHLSLAAGQTIACDGAVYVVMEPVDSAARAALGSVFGMASGEALPRDARLLLVERVERARAEGIETPEVDPEDPASVTLAL